MELRFKGRIFVDYVLRCRYENHSFILLNYFCTVLIYHLKLQPQKHKKEQTLSDYQINLLTCEKLTEMRPLWL